MSDMFAATVLMLAFTLCILGVVFLKEGLMILGLGIVVAVGVTGIYERWIQ
tara:strand:+ start:198 stop:350 length:153 start_codon:yes stop_codon:yes gene_type:complete